ncbi:MAG: response regulator [Pseudomonadota bacterium]
MSKDPYRYFRIEARELLDQLGAGVLDLEKSGSADKVSALLRLAHTLKGAAHVVRQGEIANLAHSVEEAFAPHRQDGQSIPRAAFDHILKSLDQVAAHLEQLPAPAMAATALHNGHAPALANSGQEGQPGLAAGSTNQAGLRMARADIGVVDALLEGLAEVSGELGNMKRLNASLSHIRELFTSFATQYAAQNWRESQLGAQPAPLAKIGGLVEGLHGLIVAAERGIAASTESMERELRQVHETAERLRLVPVASIFNTLERTTRDAANGVGKQLDFEAGGGDIRLDGQVLDIVQTALIQIIRNAVAHGIESPKERTASHKSAAGKISLEVTRRAYHISFRCTDDGRGIDTDAVRRAILRKELAAGTMTESTEKQIEGYSTGELLAILAKGGISTAKTVTELAGRGVGLDLVRSSVQQLGGEMVAATETGRGTTIELLVPVSLASLQALMVESAGQLLAIPLDAVQGTLRVAGSAVVQAEQGHMILHQGVLIPLVPLALVGTARPFSASRILSVVVLTAASSTGTVTAAIVVDKLHGTESIVLRSLPALAPAHAMISASFLDNEGNPQLVLDPEVLVSSLHTAPLRASVAPAPTLPILIIDDSLTTRMLESSILEAAGFAVALAASAEEGLLMARHHRYALFLVDLEMPGMNGFEFIEQAQADPVLRDIPCILVTSRDAAADKQRAAEVGASAYIVKGEFNQVDFLKTIKRLVQE